MSFYDATVPAFLQILNSLSGLLNKAETHCAAKNIQPEVLLSARLFWTCWPLTSKFELRSTIATRLRTGDAQRSAVDARHREDLCRAAAAPGQGHRLRQQLQTAQFDTARKRAT